jgi:predicted nucleic acid-binding Zn ribbon protein
MIKAGKTNEEAFAAVKKKFPAGKTTLANVAWYRNDMRKKGVKGVKAQSAVKKAAAKPKKKAAAPAVAPTA